MLSDCIGRNRHEKLTKMSATRTTPGIQSVFVRWDDCIFVLEASFAPIPPVNTNSVAAGPRVRQHAEEKTNQNTGMLEL